MQIAQTENVPNFGLHSNQVCWTIRYKNILIHYKVNTNEKTRRVPNLIHERWPNVKTKAFSKVKKYCCSVCESKYCFLDFSLYAKCSIPTPFLGFPQSVLNKKVIPSFYFCSKQLRGHIAPCREVFTTKQEPVSCCRALMFTTYLQGSAKNNKKTNCHRLILLLLGRQIFL